MAGHPDDIAVALEQLEAGVERLSKLTRGLDRSQLHSPRGSETWSANDILAHLRACADVWGKSITAMLTMEHPTLRYVSPRTWIRKTNYPELEFQPSLTVFVEQRESLLQSLRDLQPADWVRSATFTGTTRGREGTVLGYAQRLATHEAEHLSQLDLLLNQP